MSGDKITGFSKIDKSKQEFIKQLAIFALSDAKHDFGKVSAYSKNIEEVVKRGLPISEAMRREIGSLSEDKVLENLLGKGTSDKLFETARRELTPQPITINIGNERRHTHTMQAFQLYNKKGDLIKSNVGGALISKLGLNNANIIVDFDHIGLISALKTGAKDESKKLKYLLLSESFNDPAIRPSFNDGKIFSKKEGIHLQPLLQNTKENIVYSAFDPGVTSHYNDFFSKYTFTLSPVLSTANDKYTASLTITNPTISEQKETISDPKKNNAIKAVKDKLKAFLNKFMKSEKKAGEDADETFKANVKYQQKRSGDWLQSLAVQDVINRTFWNRSKDRNIYIDGDTYLVTHDRINLSYCLLTGSNAIFVNISPGKERWIYVFKKRPMPIMLRVESPHKAILTTLVTKPSQDLIKEIANNGFNFGLQLGGYLENLYSNSIKTQCDKMIASFEVDAIKNIIKNLFRYVYIIRTLPNYLNINAVITELNPKILALTNKAVLDNADCALIDRYNTFIGTSKAIIDNGHNWSKLIDYRTLRTMKEFESIDKITTDSKIEDYQFYHYIRNNSTTAYETMNLRTLVAATFEKCMRSTYFDVMDSTVKVGILRLLLVGLIELSVEQPDPIVIQTFHEVISKGVLEEKGVFNYTIDEDAVAEILINMASGYEEVANYHLLNDPIYRKSTDDNKVVQLWYDLPGNNIVSEGGGITGVMQLTKTKRVSPKEPTHKALQISSAAALSAPLPSPASYPSPSKIRALPQITSRYGHHPMTPLLYIQYKLIARMQEADIDTPDFYVYYILSNVINIFMKELSEVIARDIETDSHFYGLVIKYLLYVYVHEEGGDRYLPITEDGTNTNELLYLLSLITDPIGLKVDVDHFGEILRRTAVHDFLGRINAKIAGMNMKLNVERFASFKAKLFDNLNYVKESLIRIGSSVKTRKRSRFTRKRSATKPVTPITVGLKRGRSPIESSDNNNNTNMKTPSVAPSPTRKRRKTRSRNTVRAPTGTLRFTIPSK